MHRFDQHATCIAGRAPHGRRLGKWPVLPCRPDVTLLLGKLMIELMTELETKLSRGSDVGRLAIFQIS